MVQDITDEAPIQMVCTYSPFAKVDSDRRCIGLEYVPGGKTKHPMRLRRQAGQTITKQGTS